MGVGSSGPMWGAEEGAGHRGWTRDLSLAVLMSRRWSSLQLTRRLSLREQEAKGNLGCGLHCWEGRNGQLAAHWKLKRDGGLLAVA